MNAGGASALGFCFAFACVDPSLLPKDGTYVCGAGFPRGGCRARERRHGKVAHPHGSVPFDAISPTVKGV